MCKYSSLPLDSHGQNHRLATLGEDVPFHAGYEVCHWPSSYELVLVVNVVGSGGLVVEGGGSDGVMVRPVLAEGVTGEAAVVEDEAVGEGGIEEEWLAMDDMGVTTGLVLVLELVLVLALELVLVVGVETSETVWVSTTVTGGDEIVVPAPIGTTEMLVSVAVMVLVASLALAPPEDEAVIVTLSVVVLVSGDEVTVFRMVVASFVPVDPPSMGTTE